MADAVAGGVEPLAQPIARLGGLPFGEERIAEQLAEAGIARQQRLAFQDVRHVGVGVLGAVIAVREAVVAEDVAFARPAGQHLSAERLVDIFARNEPRGLDSVTGESGADSGIALRARQQVRILEVEVVDGDREARGTVWRCMYGGRGTEPKHACEDGSTLEHRLTLHCRSLGIH